MRSNWLAVLVLGVLLAVAFQPIGAVGDEPKQGGTLTVHLEGDPPTLNPIFGTSVVTGWPTAQIFSSLVQYDLDLNPIPDLAETWSVSSDGLAYTFHLASGVEWHDGTAFTSADVKFTFDLINSGFGAGRILFAAIFESVEAPDANTVIINLKTPYAPLLKFLGNYWGPIIPKHLYEGTDILQNSHNFDNPVGTGPFKWVEWVKGSHITLVRNEEYFKPGLPYLDRIIFRIIPSYPTALVAFEAGEIDYMPKFILYSELGRLVDMSDVVVTQIPQYWSGTWSVWLNHRNPILEDVRVRKALAHAIDISLITDRVYYGWGRTAKAPMDWGGISNWAYDSQLDEFFPEYNLAKANQLLEQAGYSRGADDNRFSLELITLMGAADLVKSSEIIREQLRDVGVVVTIRLLEIGTLYQTAMIDWDFEMLYMNNGWGPDPTRSMFHYHSKNMVPGWLMNLAGYNNSRVDELYEQGLVESDLAKRKDIYVEIQEILLTDQVALYIVASDAPSLHRSHVQGVPPGAWLSWDHFEGLWVVQEEPQEGLILGIPAIAFGAAVAIAAGAVAVIVLAFIWYRRRRQ